MATTREMKYGDTKRDLVLALTTEDGAAQDLTGCTVEIVLSNGAELAASVVSPASDGQVKHVFDTGTLLPIGTYGIEVRVTFADGRTETWPSGTPGSAAAIRPPQLIVHKEHPV